MIAIKESNLWLRASLNHSECKCKRAADGVFCLRVSFMRYVCEINYTGNLVLYPILNPPPWYFSHLPVSDSKFPKEAFSISATDDAANTVDEQEDVDECQLYQGQLCQHTCTNIWGSYRCSCHQGYTLQPDRHSCAPGGHAVTHHGRLIHTGTLWHHLDLIKCVINQGNLCSAFEKRREEVMETLLLTAANITFAF